ncbi:hypothetical protein SAMN05892877_1293 [Rhizobium subbaraonis]|uniref:2'-5' RNA ligase superfamily protein n=1 Tax=Rhizobium subbaraonis TaxID=908946 RepID=A0A285V4A6_9HYPH|nr:hypothetical protein [Rhizobium subbaraonis]SOC47341.1 hypothetical protein SAMN05892877_1293 [Rhizobium subbaraonis]
MSELTAIDILIKPDQRALDHAAAQNRLLRAGYAEGFALDDSHQPHITLLQRYVRSTELEAVFSAIERLLRTHDVSALSFRATALRHMPVGALPGVGIAAIVVSPSPEVLEMQRALIDALKPFTASGGTADAFVVTPQDRQINTDTLAYVEKYVPDHSGPNYIAHLTVGLAPLDLLGQIEAQPFEEFAFSPSAIAAFKLGNNGTARRELKAWPAVPSFPGKTGRDPT